MDREQHLRLLCGGTADVVSAAELGEALQKKGSLRVKFGADPSAPDLHLGHYVALRKLRQFQDLGHTVIFLIGDFTGMIGDPTGRSSTRVALSREQVAANAKTYQEQVFRVLDRAKTEIRFNSEWMDKFGAADMVRLCSKSTVARMLERDDFEKRYRGQQPIGLHEFLYPMVQGWDSVELKCDVELGGTDQRFNLLVGRDLQRDAGQTPQVVITMPLLEGLDGHNKMSKSLGNSIGFADSPDDMFGKVMSVSDELMLRYFALLSDDDAAAIGAEIAQGTRHPMEEKKRLAAQIVAIFHGDEAAQAARAGFESRFQRRETPGDAPVVTWSYDEPEVKLIRFLQDAKLAASGSDGRRLIAGGGVRIDGNKITDPQATLARPAAEAVIQVGSRRIVRLKG